MAATRAPGAPRTYDAAVSALLYLVDNNPDPPRDGTPAIPVMGSMASVYRDDDGVRLLVTGPEPQLWTFEARIGAARGYPVVVRSRGHLTLRVAAPGWIVSPATAADPVAVQVREALLCLTGEPDGFALPAGRYRCARGDEMYGWDNTDALVLVNDDTGDRAELALEVYPATPVADLPDLTTRDRSALACVAAGRIRLVPDTPFGDAITLDGKLTEPGVVLRLLHLGLIRAFPDGATALTAEGRALLPTQPDTGQEW